MQTFLDFISDLLEKDTLIIVFAFALALKYPGISEVVAGGFIGYIAKTKIDKKVNGQ